MGAGEINDDMPDADFLVQEAYTNNNKSVIEMS